MRNYLSLLQLLQYIILVSSDCQFKANEAQEEKRIIAINTNGQLEALNEDKVKTGTTLYYICTNEDVIEVQCNDNNEFSQTLPVNQCDSPMAAVVEKIQDSSCKADTYRIGYAYSQGFLELYRSCYGTSKLRALYSVYTAKPFSLGTKRPGNRFTTDNIMTQADAETFKPQNILTRFQELFGKDQTYVSSNLNDILINRGHLAPSGDFLFFNNARATFKLVNIMPQIQSINSGNWRKIEDWIKEQVVANGAATVKTGAFGLLSLPKADQSEMVAVYLQNDERNPVSEWTYKILKNSQSSTAFLVYNNIFYKDAPDVSELCQVVDCPIATKKGKKFGLTFCCEPQHFENTVLAKFQ